MISYIIKRDGRRESFDLDKIANAVFRAAQSVGGTDAAMARDVAEKTCALYEQLHGSQEPTVEEIQDLVEKELIECGHAQNPHRFCNTLFVKPIYRTNRLTTALFSPIFMNAYFNGTQ